MNQMELPEGWLKVQIDEVADIVAGGTPSASDDSNFAVPGKGIAWLTPADLSGYKLKEIANGKRDLSQKGYDSSSAKLMPKGSVLFSSRAPIGYVAIAANEISTNQGFKSFVFRNIDSSYAYFYLRSIRDVAESLGTGTTFKELSGAATKKLPFVFPPLAEQKVIADKLDTLLAQVESIKTRLERIPEILKQFRQAVLAAAVTGKLTEEWRDINGLDESYKIVENIPFETPRAWSFHRLEQITSRVTYGLTKRPPYVSDGVAVISAKEIRTGFVNFEVASQISESDFDGLREKCKIFPGDLLFSKTGSIGHVAIYNAEFQSASSQNIAVITPLLNLVMCQFLYYYLRSPFIQELAQSSVKANAIPDLQLGIISKFPIQLPLLVEQKVIVEKVESIFSTIDGIEQQAKSALDRVNNLTQSILAKAFRGELTADWREANPELISGKNSAEALLERIKAERSIKPVTKRDRGKA
ncbi:restriction endonuclease subunit S [Acinetobacter higginsii]|uniref:restriction endonuclease subunit S n=1 Tax=Acinetobacter higginsii TaxID=70347 RepID=UPI001F4A7603|nr:restriction endonuclease subunit S [Acinetobacter higginsii]MCH7296164.1 restriction endonuclease subunit S [Acinetobacter higginsii]